MNYKVNKMYKDNYKIVNKDKLSSMTYINEGDYREKYYYIFLKLKKIKHGSSLKSKFLNTKLSFYDLIAANINFPFFDVLNKIFNTDFDSLSINDIKKIVECNNILINYCDTSDYIERYVLTAILFVRYYLHEMYGTKINF